MTVNELSEKYYPYVVEMRRYFHMHPELSFKEFETSKRVQQELDSMGIPYYVVPDTTNVVATIKGGKSGRTILLRADMDGLPVQEMNECPYRSTVDGAMHACGHDGHTASLLGAAKILLDMRDEICGTVKLLFESGEEFRGSFFEVEKSGVLDDVDHCFAIHVWSEIPVGKVAFEAGSRMAGTELFNLKITGKGAHASAPHQGVDALVAAASVIMNLQTIVSRELSPQEVGVVTIGKMTAGQRFNIIPEEAVLEGNLRYFNPDLELGYKDMIERIAMNTAAAFRCSCEMTLFGHGTPAVVNTEDEAKFGQGVVGKLFGDDALTHQDPIMAGEDFAFYMDKLTGGFAFIGAKFDGKPFIPHHAGNFDIDEQSLKMASALHAQYAIDWLKENS